MKKIEDKIFLGTVKLGVPDYGFSSGSSGPGFDPVKFLGHVSAAGINRFDTSPRYGNSEEIIGRYIKESGRRPFIASKIDNLDPDDKDIVRIMEDSVRSSLRKLHLETLDLCYLHQNELEIITSPLVHEGLSLLKQKGLIRSAGASIYTMAEAEAAVSSGVFDFLQLPISVFDMRFYDFIRKHSGRVKFVARSLLLQGMLINREEIKRRVSQAEEALDYLRELDEIAQRNSLSTLGLALGFVGGLPEIDYYIIGTTSFENLKNDIELMKIRLPEDIISQLSGMAASDRDWLNPRNWIKL